MHPQLALTAGIALTRVQTLHSALLDLMRFAAQPPAPSSDILSWGVRCTPSLAHPQTAEGALDPTVSVVMILKSTGPSSDP